MKINCDSVEWGKFVRRLNCCWRLQTTTTSHGVWSDKSRSGNYVSRPALHPKFRASCCKASWKSAKRSKEIKSFLLGTFAVWCVKAFECGVKTFATLLTNDLHSFYLDTGWNITSNNKALLLPWIINFQRQNKAKKIEIFFPSWKHFLEKCTHSRDIFHHPTTTKATNWFSVFVFECSGTHKSMQRSFWVA